MATKKKTAAKKPAAKKTATKKAAPKKSDSIHKDIMCSCNDCWEKNAWMILFGIAIGICVGFVLGVTKY